MDDCLVCRPAHKTITHQSVLYQMMFWQNLILLMMSTRCSKHVQVWNKYIEKSASRRSLTRIITILFYRKTVRTAYQQRSCFIQFHSPCCGFRCKHIHITVRFHEADYVRKARDGCISLHAQLCLLGTKSIVSKVPFQTSCINLCFALALLRVSLSMPSWTSDCYWERTLEKELRNAATAILRLERRVTEYFMRLTSGASCVNSSKIFHTQLLYTGCSSSGVTISHD